MEAGCRRAGAPDSRPPAAHQEGELGRRWRTAVSAGYGVDEHPRHGPAPSCTKGLVVSSDLGCQYRSIRHWGTSPGRSRPSSDRCPPGRYIGFKRVGEDGFIHNTSFQANHANPGPSRRGAAQLKGSGKIFVSLWINPVETAQAPGSFLPTRKLI